jgi:hypothetical protein
LLREMAYVSVRHHVTGRRPCASGHNDCAASGRYPVKLERATLFHN